MSLSKAILYATKKHELQKRKHMQVPFIDHPLRVMHYVIQDAVYGGDDVTASIAICHDVPEDCSESETDEDRIVIFNEIEEICGTDVRHGVNELTNEYTKSRYPKWNREKRKEHEIKRLLDISDCSRTIKLYDRLCNLEDTIRCSNAHPKFTRLFAKESWDLSYALATPENHRVSGLVMVLATQLTSMSLIGDA